MKQEEIPDWIKIGVKVLGKSSLSTSTIETINIERNEIKYSDISGYDFIDTYERYYLPIGQKIICKNKFPIKIPRVSQKIVHGTGSVYTIKYFINVAKEKQKIYFQEGGWDTTENIISTYFSLQKERCKECHA